MSVKEKLVELKKVLRECLHFNYDEFSCNMSLDVDLTAENLIAHGVTVQEWISVNDRLPEYGKRVLITEGTFIFIDQICADGNWLLVDWEVTHWMPLPQPPKGD